MDKEITRRWGVGIPSPEELAPLSTRLITPVLACAFNIEGDSGASLTEEEVDEAALNTVRGGMERATPSQVSPQENPQVGPPLVGFADGRWDGGGADGAEGYPGEEPTNGVAILQGVHGNMPAYGAFSGGVENSQDGGGKKARARPAESMEGEDELEGMEHTSDDPPGRALKRPRLVWTPQLHKRFCDAVNHLGVENAVPKTIMQLMNVEGLTRENVASHLQKYRLYLRQRFQTDAPAVPSSSDAVFANGPQPPRGGGSAGPALSGGGEGDLGRERGLRMDTQSNGHSIGLTDGAPPQQDVGYRDYGGYPASMQLSGRPAPEPLEMDAFGRPLKRQKFVDQRALAAHGQLQ
ncbi:hypothetical protein KFL_005370090 [Klebsormidium nitens]|uniref:Myb-like domain-containing protein n=1 Tax=Klebsormidium nitens TaxID=105231 RepID=A0A1Y1IHL6_KLENI|nr:hypothetical protein KFL_005370090 [Klebsormidium nitens]|eukprot:GAQ89572.1 hypothetical protein KFL_005370090 [Klebsormidium nitens]